VTLRHSRLSAFIEKNAFQLLQKLLRVPVATFNLGGEQLVRQVMASCHLFKERRGAGSPLANLPLADDIAVLICGSRNG